jgi:hypothetical protein
MPSMVCDQSIVLDVFLNLLQVDWEEGGQDETHEHGHAGMHPCQFYYMFLIGYIKPCKVTCHPYLFDGAVSLSILLS